MREPKPRVRCPRCQGQGVQYRVEDARSVQDPCYHCATEGWVSEEQWQGDRFEEAVNRIAEREVHALEKACEEPDEDGYSEGWSLAAAEAGCSLEAYRMGRTLDAAETASEVLQDLEKTHLGLFRALLDLLAPDGAEREAKAEYEPTLPPLSEIEGHEPWPASDIEIPF